jgi:hypothetical protein
MIKSIFVGIIVKLVFIYFNTEVTERMLLGVSLFLFEIFELISFIKLVSYPFSPTQVSHYFCAIIFSRKINDIKIMLIKVKSNLKVEN